jgi:hypothetical protein
VVGVIAYGQNTPKKNTKKTKEKHLGGEGEIKKGERVRGEKSSLGG